MTDEPRPCILIVDDSPTSIHVLANALERSYDIRVARDGMTALEAMEREVIPDLVLLDVVMPGMDGYTVCLRMKQSERLKDIPVIFITSQEDTDEEARGLAVGGIDYVSKPFVPQLVQLRVRNHLLLKRQRDLLVTLSTTDGLTGVHNRRAFDECLAKEWKRAQRRGDDVSTLMIDIDHFKAYNDTYGHLAGDRALREVAHELQSSIYRPADFCARIGGEEFACILPTTPCDGATHVARRFANRLAALAVVHQSSPTAAHLTVSVGVATLRPALTASFTDLLARADAALYEAKRSGRNRIVAYSASGRT